MGSFNVSCSVSRISIRCGMKVAFIPLLPNVYDFSTQFDDSADQKHMGKLRIEHHVGVQTQLIYPNCYFNPFSLPIIGEYNDYGSLENIEIDANTKAIERYFDLTINEFIDAVTGRDSIAVKYSIKKFNYQSEIKITPKGIKDFNFEKVQGKRSTYVDPNCPEYHVILTKPTIKEGDYDHKNYNVKILHVESKVIKWESDNNPHDVHHDFFSKWEEFTHRLINYREEDFHKILLLRKLSGMFVHYDVYQHLHDQIPHDDFNNSKSVADSYVKAEQLDVLGFEKVTDQWVIDSHCDALYRKGEYDIKIGSYGSVILPTSEKEYACLGDKRFVKETRQIWEKYTKTKVEDTFPEPAPKADNSTTATKEEWKAICDKFEELTGIKPRYSHHKNKKSAYRLAQFKDMWFELTGELLNIKQWEEYYQADKEYDEVQKASAEYQEKLKEPDVFETCTYPSIEKQQSRYDQMTTLLSQMQMKDKRMPFDPKPEGETYQVKVDLRDRDNPWHSFANDKFSFLRFYKEWDYFEDLYKQSIIDNELKIEFREYRNFYWSFYSTNGFFFPAHNGEQFGNYKALKSLYDKCSELMQNEINEDDDY